MKDKIAVVTGANSGIGREMALVLARMGAQVAVLCRTPEKAAGARDELGRLSGSGGITAFAADFSELGEVRRAAGEIQARFDRVDVLINNAGFLGKGRQATAEGHEVMFTVNHLAPFLLTNLLMPALKAAGVARVVTVASEAHRLGKLVLEDLDSRRVGPYQAYCDSKLANVLFSAELARRMQSTRVTANAFDPGLVTTGFGRDASAAMKLLIRLSKPFMVPPEKGARTGIYLATAPEAAEHTGRYFKVGKPVAPAALAMDLKARAKLWEVSARMTGLA